MYVFFFKQKTAYEMRISDWSSDVCSSDLKLMKDGIAGKILAMRSLRELYELLVSVESFGPFLAFQLTIDLNYSSALNFDEAEFVVPGPGALHGISKCFEDLGGLSPTDVILEMPHIQEEDFARLGLAFPGLFGRRLQQIGRAHV